MAIKYLNALAINGNGGTVLDVQGSQGQLFSVTDSLTGDIFAVSDISGVPILKVVSSGIVLIDGSLSSTGNATVGGFVEATGGFLVPYAAATKKPMINLVGATNYGLWHTEGSDDIFSFDFGGVSKQQFFQSGNAIFAGTITGQNIYGNQFVDAQDNDYYANPAGTSVMSGADFDGDVTVTTQAVGDDSTLVATTEYADRAAANVPIGNYLPLTGGTMANTDLVTNMNADLLDDFNASQFLRSDAADTSTGEILFDAGFKSDSILLSGAQNFDNISRSGFYNLYNVNTGSTNSPGFDYGTMVVVGGNKQNSSFGFQMANERLGNGLYIRGMNDTASAWSSWAEVWTSTTDGTGSGLDADKLDGQQGTYYLDYANFTGTPTIPTVGDGEINGATSGLGITGSMSATANQAGDTTFTVTSNV